MELARPEAKRGVRLQGTFESQFVGWKCRRRTARDFPGGWGYFNFTGRGGTLLPRSTGIRGKPARRATWRTRDRQCVHAVLSRVNPVRGSTVEMP